MVANEREAGPSQKRISREGDRKPGSFRDEGGKENGGHVPCTGTLICGLGEIKVTHPLRELRGKEFSREKNFSWSKMV